MTHVFGSIPVDIDDAWLTANGGDNGTGPWTLAADTKYRLVTNPVATGTAELGTM